MKNKVIIYSSKHGHTKQFAEYIAKEINCDVYSIKEFNNEDIKKYDVLIFGSHVTAGKFSAVSKFKKLYDKHSDRNYIFFAVGSTNPEDTDYWKMVEGHNISKQALLNKTKFFALAGGIDYQSLGRVSKSVIKMIANQTAVKKNKNAYEEKLANVVQQPIENDYETAQPLIDYVKTL